MSTGTVADPMGGRAPATVTLHCTRLRRSRRSGALSRAVRSGYSATEVPQPPLRLVEKLAHPLCFGKDLACHRPVSVDRRRGFRRRCRVQCLRHPSSHSARNHLHDVADDITGHAQQTKGDDLCELGQWWNPGGVWRLPA